MKLGFLASVFSLVLIFANSQDYYAEYARGAGLGRKNNKGSIVVGGLCAVAGCAAGWLYQGNRLKKKYDKEKKDIIQYMQLQEEIYKQREGQWQKEYNKLYKAYEEMEKETIERDYEEFKAPDTNNDDMISRSEFNIYVRKYLSSFPELSEKDFPKFEEFDLNNDGIVSFEEWQQFLYQQKLKEAQQGKASKQQGGYNDLLNALYEQSNSADSFNALQKNMGANAKGQGARRG